MHELEKGYYTSPRWSYEILDCSMPVTFDTYSNCAFNCLPGETLVLLSNGEKKKIDDLKIGDKLWSYDITDMSIKESTVTKIAKRYAKDIVRIRSTRSIRATAEHPIYTRNGWVKAGNIVEGDEILTVYKGNIISTNPLHNKSLTPEGLAKASARIKKLWKEGAIKSHIPTAKQSEAISKWMKLHNPSKTAKGRERARVRMIKMWENGEVKFPSQRRYGMGNYSNGQTALYNILDKIGMKYEKEYCFYADETYPNKSRMFVDAFLPEQKLVVEYDGFPYHSFAETGEKDKLRDKWLKDKGLTVLRIVGDDIQNPERVSQTIIRTNHRVFRKVKDVTRYDKKNSMKLGEGWVYDIELDKWHNFVANNVLVHNCQYCFSFFKRANDPMTQEAYLSHKVKSVEVKHVIDMFTDPDKYGGQFTYYIKNRIPMQWGGLSDGFDYYEKKFGLSLELLKFFRKINYPISISTKGTWFVKDPKYVEAIYGGSNIHWKVSIITLDAEKAAIVEKGVPTPMERFETLRILKELGAGGTTLRFRPFIIGISEDSLEQMVEEAVKAKCDSVTTEFLCLESRATGTASERFSEISRAAGFDVVEYYRKNSAKASGLMRLSYELKRPYIDRFKKVCADNNIDFFVSDAHHKGESCTAACCGLPRTPMFSNYAKGHFAEALQIAKRKGYVLWDDISANADYLKVIDFIRAQGFPMDTPERAKRKYQSLYDYMHDLWNTPSSFMGPARYFSGAVVPASTDENGDIIYVWNKPYIEESKESESVVEILGTYTKEKVETMELEPNVKYPVCIPSIGRAPYLITSDALIASGINFKLFVPAGQYEAYEQKYPGTTYCIPDKSSLAQVRQEILNYAKMQGVDKVWMLDDDLLFVKPANTTLSVVEYMADQYTNIIMASPAMENADPWPTWNIDKVSPTKCMLVSTGTDIPFRHHDEFPMMSHIEFQLERLATGNWHVLVDYRNRINTKFLPGGMNWAYIAANGSLPRKASRIIHEKFKHNTYIDDNLLLAINWRTFSSGAMPKVLRNMIGGK
jgi:DNA repair photolyase